jgi:hypothetical protein
MLKRKSSMHSKSYGGRNAYDVSDIRFVKGGSTGIQRWRQNQIITRLVFVQCNLVVLSSTAQCIVMGSIDVNIGLNALSASSSE